VAMPRLADSGCSVKYTRSTQEQIQVVSEAYDEATDFHGQVQISAWG
jgi:hypothetical protein